MSRAVISVGSNVDRQHKVGEAVEALRRNPLITVVAVSCVHESAAVGGPAGLPDFYNVAVVADTALEAGMLRKELRAIEERLGRIRTDDRFAPRTIDLDVTLFDDEEIDLEGTSIPDPDLLVEAHVAVPVAQVAPNWTVPSAGKTVKEIAEALDTSGVTVVPMHELPPVTRAQFEPDAIGFEARAGEVYDHEFEGLIRQMLVRVGEDPDRDGLARTPLRVAKALDFLTSGYTMSLEELLNEAIFEVEAAEEMVILKDIEFYSMCEHHMLPFYGKAHIAYLPRGRVIGVSKMARLVDMFARRLQVQERLTNQVADALMDVLDPHGAAVVMQAAHLCMLMRGVQKQNSLMVTSAMRGTFKEDARTRSEFMGLID